MKVIVLMTCHARVPLELYSRQCLGELIVALNHYHWAAGYQKDVSKPFTILKMHECSSAERP